MLRSPSHSTAFAESPERPHSTPTRAEIVAQVRTYERRYEMRSRDVAGAIDRGEIRETHEVCRWLIYHDLLERTRAP